MRLSFRALALFGVALCVGLALCCRNMPLPPPGGGEAPSAASQPAAPPADRPADWATPLSRPGLLNLHQVADNLYRGAQPTEVGFLELKAMGIKTVINLRNFHDGDDRKYTAQAGLELAEIPMKTWQVDEDDAIRFLRIVTDKSRGPFFVHCQHGADRTGSMIAAYRVVIGDWSKERAVQEMCEGGYGFHSVWRNLPKFIEALDVEKLRRACGAPGTPAAPGAEQRPPPTPGTLPT